MVRIWFGIGDCVSRFMNGKNYKPDIFSFLFFDNCIGRRSSIEGIWSFVVMFFNVKFYVLLYGPIFCLNAEA